LLLIRGVTQELYWGLASTNHPGAAFQRLDRRGRLMQQPNYSAGLVEILTPLSRGRININTASSTVLATVPGIDQNIAEQIITMRSGPDGSDGTEDDSPAGGAIFRRVEDLLVNAGVANGAAPQVAQNFDVRSYTFEVRVDAEVGGSRQTFFAIVGRNNPRDVALLSFYWR
jgi:type II secretory pathway component PulK